MAIASDLFKADIRTLGSLLRERSLSARELTAYFLHRIETLNPQLNAVLTVTAERAMAAADEADSALQRGTATPLTGIPLLHKDAFCTRDVRTTCGSKMLADFHPPYDATVVSRLAQAGMVSLGKCNMDEFAMGSSNENSFFGPCHNPWNTDRVPGGSSGGSAAAVAAGLAPVATGTDTGGSIRQPASFCGITGIKPTYGRVSRLGMVAFASSLDQAGPMAGSVDDCALMLNAMAGVDAGDSTSADVAVPDFSAALGQPIDGLRIGLPQEYFSSHLDAAIAERIHAALKTLEQAGAKLVEIALPRTQQAIATYYVIAPAEASANLSRYDGVRFGHRCENPTDLSDLYRRSRSEGFGEEVKRRILVGTYALSTGYYDAYFKKAQQVRRLISDDFQRAFEQVDVIAGPAAPGVAFGIGEKSDDPLTLYMEDIYTLAVNLAGLPGLSLPAGQTGEMPVGLQLIGRAFDEETLFRAGSCLQARTDWHRQRPAMAEVTS